MRVGDFGYPPAGSTRSFVGEDVDDPVRHLRDLHSPRTAAPGSLIGLGHLGRAAGHLGRTAVEADVTLRPIGDLGPLTPLLG